MGIIKTFANADDIAEAALDYVLKAAQESIADHGIFNIVLSGGSTPRKLYELLAGQANIDWSKWQFFMGDERFVPLDDERSNQKLANDTLLSKVGLSDSQIHPVPVDQASAEAAAQAYEQEIRNYFKSDLPSFDLILLGMGSDGHTASLFPAKPALDVRDKLVFTSEPGILPPPVERITFTFPLINSANRVLFLVAGSDKVEAFQKVRSDLQKDAIEAQTPAGRVRPAGELLWFVDKAVAG